MAFEDETFHGYIAALKLDNGEVLAAELNRRTAAPTGGFVFQPAITCRSRQSLHAKNMSKPLQTGPQAAIPPLALFLRCISINTRKAVNDERLLNLQQPRDGGLRRGGPGQG
ncbi:hypothetical protein [Pseudomonas sp. NPDC096950]|uniref:hypothetical protein n=1 Tax=Pseudomonas sp. NPDC096950 TaxID=3364485 RepID=UPI00383B5025